MKEPGQIVLFRFPRADLSEGKLRPALLLAEVPGSCEDWLICMISSQVHQRIDGFDVLLEEDDADFARSGLKVTSVIRIGRLAVVDGDAGGKHWHDQPRTVATDPEETCEVDWRQRGALNESVGRIPHRTP